MEQIKACPCCGGPGQLKDVRGRIRRGWVGCPACSLYINWQIDPAGAVKKWNRRTAAHDSVLVALTPAAINLLKSMPEAVNELAVRLERKLTEAVLYGEGGKP